jgi:alpha-tubulin suppressor-like RCC1 family protein
MALAPSWSAASEALPCRPDGGALSCWGGRARLPAAPGAVEAPPAARTVVVAGDHACALAPEGALWCWEQGEGAPARVRGVSDAAGVALGYLLGCARRRTGTVACWGFDGATRLRAVPVPGLEGVEEVSAGFGHACARRAEGTVHCWGDNHYGQLGDGTRKSRRHPARVRGLDTVVEISLGFYASCARRAEGSVHCWGNGWGGEDGTDDRLLVPAKVRAIHDATGIVATNDGLVALEKGGQLVACQYRLGPEESEASPRLVCERDEARARGMLGRAKVAVLR